ncbi:hypothetical protein CBM2617_A200034 [Cupriavidus taiwanensis]|nr:hypothetical protein CBM2617_A200034 [Cupriavidus taiwanensis]
MVIGGKDQRDPTIPCAEAYWEDTLIKHKLAN